MKSLPVVTILMVINQQGIFSLTRQSKNDEKLPIYAPDKCTENQLLYPKSPKSDDWVCDCGPGFLYYQPKDACFPAYRQGACPPGKHLILKPNKSVAECLNNPCDDGYARYKGKCYQLGAPEGPCVSSAQGGGIFNVNSTTLTVECIENHDPLSLFNIPRNCPRGSKRDSNNECRENWNV